MSHFGDTVRTLRRRSGMTQNALAGDIFVYAQTIQRLERGIGTPTIATIVRLARALGVPPARLAAAAIRDHSGE